VGIKKDEALEFLMVEQDTLRRLLEGGKRKAKRTLIAQGRD
jgi:hypothetical protein